MDGTATLGYRLRRDLTASLVIFLAALPLCLGIALASNAPLISGLISGIIGGIIVGSLSHSQTSVSGPAAGLTAVVATQIALLGSFEAFLLAVTLGGLLQVIAGLCRAGFISMFIPSGVVKGMLTGIGMLLILKQLPYLVGHDGLQVSDSLMIAPQNQGIYQSLISLTDLDWHAGAMVIGFLSVLQLILWDRVPVLKRSSIPGPLFSVILGVTISQLLFSGLGAAWQIPNSQLVQVPVFNGPTEYNSILVFPDFSRLADSKVYMAALTIAIVASLETLLNLEAVDRLDPQQRHSPRSRELFAQGIGNITAGLTGGLPVTSVIVRSSLNINSGGQTKFSAIMNGCLLLGCFLLIPQVLNLIPLACLAGILLVTGYKLASPALIRQMYQAGRYQFIPYSCTAIFIVVTDILTGILLGLATSISFILYSNMRCPLHRVLEKHIGGDVLRIELANQVSFFNRAAIERALLDVPRDGFVVIDGRKTDYIDPDVLSLLHDFQNITAPARGIRVSLQGFRNRYDPTSEIRTIDYSKAELRGQLTPDDVLRLLMEGNQRFRAGVLTRMKTRPDYQEEPSAHNSFVTILSCIDCYMPVESVFDLKPENVYSVQVAGNVIDTEVVNNLEYGSVLSGTPLLLVLGHTRCGAIRASLEQKLNGLPTDNEDCTHLNQMVNLISESIQNNPGGESKSDPDQSGQLSSDRVSQRNVQRAVESILASSVQIRKRVQEGTLGIVGAIYHDDTGVVELLKDDSANSSRLSKR